MLLFWGFAHNLLSLLDKLKVEPKKKNYVFTNFSCNYQAAYKGLSDLIKIA